MEVLDFYEFFYFDGYIFYSFFVLKRASKLGELTKLLNGTFPFLVVFGTGADHTKSFLIPILFRYVSVVIVIGIKARSPILSEITTPF